MSDETTCLGCGKQQGVKAPVQGEHYTCSSCLCAWGVTDVTGAPYYHSLEEIKAAADKQKEKK